MAASLDLSGYEWDGLAAVETWLRTCVSRPARPLDYVVLYDRSDRATRGEGEQLDRLDLDGVPGIVGTVWPEGSTSRDPDRIVAHVLAWLQATSARCTVGRRHATFRARGYGPKGQDRLGQAQFVCRWTAGDDLLGEAAAENGGTPLATWEELQASVTGGPLAALAQGYARLLELVLRAAAVLQERSEVQVGRLHTQLQEAQGAVDTLLGRLVDAHHQDMERAVQERTAAGAEGTKVLIAREGIASLSGLAQLWLAQQGDPALVALVGSLSAHPELGPALRDPTVQQLLRDPNHARDLAGLLRTFAAGPSAPEPHDADEDEEAAPA